MLGLSRKWMILVVVVGIIKIILAVLTPIASDFVNFVRLAESAFNSLSYGAIPFLSVYSGLAVLLAPFFWLWTMIPIAHPGVSAMLGIFYFNVSVEAFLFTFALKLPILLFDLLAGVLVFFLVRDATGSSDNGGKAFLFWYLNPYNIFMLEMWGSMDVIPATFVLVAILLALKKRWIFSGLTLSLAAVVRIYPLLLLPVFLWYCLRKSRRTAIAFVASFCAPLGAAMIVLIRMFGSAQAAIDTFMGIAFDQTWLLRFYGLSLLPGIQNTFDRVGLPLALFLYPIQLYISSKFWKTQFGSLISLTTAFLLIHFATTSYEPYHFNWITPLLAVCYGIDRRRFRLLTILFMSAYIAMYTYADVSLIGNAFFLFPPYTVAIQSAAFLQQQLRPLTQAYDPLSMGFFHGLLAVLLIRLNLEELKPIVVNPLKNPLAFEAGASGAPIPRSTLQGLFKRLHVQAFVSLRGNAKRMRGSIS